MRNPLLRLATLLLSVGAVFASSAQVVTTSPDVLQSSSRNIVITFHADRGNRGLEGVAPPTKVYAHTGVITNLSTGASDWKYAPAWGTNSEKYEMDYAGVNTWTLTIRDINTYYGVPATETVRDLAFVFRTADNSREGKTADGGDIFVPVYPDGFSIESEQMDYPGGTPKMGTVENEDGTVTFCLAAPGKENMMIVGSWNDYAFDSNSPMFYQDYQGNRYFWTTVDGLQTGKDFIYYFIADGTVRVGDPYARLVLDPYNDQYISPSVFPGLPAYPKDKVSNVPLAVYNSSAGDYEWKNSSFTGVAQSELIIYELLIRDFTGEEGQANGSGTVQGVIDKLDYIKALGVNAVELLPIMEFNGNNSWGYNTNFYFAPDKAYGTPDDYRRLVDECHSRGLAVILDVVFNQSDGLHPWYQLYPIASNPFYNGSAPHAYSVLNDWNQDNQLVQQQWHDVLKYWLTEYKVDGFRFDLVKGLGSNQSYGNTYYPATNTWGTPSDAKTNAYNQSRVDRMKALHAAMKTVNPNAYFINENLAGAQEENAMAEDGEINWANVNTESAQFVMGYQQNSGLNRFYAPLDQRTWGSTVSYAESHDEERLAYRARQNGGSGIKGSTSMTCRRLGSLAAQMLLTPGAHMIWQFQEFGADQTTKNSSGNDTSPKRVVWSYLDNEYRAGLHQNYQDLCWLRRSNPELFRESTSTTIALGQNDWAAGRYIALQSGDKELYLVVNPNTEERRITVNALKANAETYKVMAVSYNVTPGFSGKSVTLPAGAFVVLGSQAVSGIGDTVEDSSTVGVWADASGNIVVDGDYRQLEVYTTSGARVSPRSLAPGLYIVVVDSVATKLLVR